MKKPRKVFSWLTRGEGGCRNLGLRTQITTTVSAKKAFRPFFCMQLNLIILHLCKGFMSMFTDLLSSFGSPSETKIYEKETRIPGEAKRHPARILEALTNALPCIEITPTGVVLSVSKAVLDQLDTSLESVRGAHYTQILASVADEEGGGRFEDVLRSSEPVKMKLQLVTTRGTWEPFDCSVIPVVAPNGAIERVVCVGGENSASVSNSSSVENLAALDENYARIEFDTTGIIQTANDNFTSAVGYQLDEIIGKHHRIFCDQHWVTTDSYRNFWSKLAEGISMTGEVKRFGKSGNEIWIAAMYTPVRDSSGRIHKVVKYAGDVTKKRQHLTAVFESFVEVQNKLNQVSDQIALASGATVRTIQESMSQTSEISANMSATAAATTEMGASIQEISNNTSKSVRKADQAVVESRSANGRLTSLTEGSKKIAEVARAIESIARQTNLLALNATIEASRAGEAGLGFGVVASEVKALAGETQKATEQINKSISEIQGGTQLVTSSLQAVDTVIQEICDYSTSIAGAIEEQTATTSEVERSTSAVAGSMRVVELGLHSISDQASTTNHASEEMVQQLDRMKDLVKQLTTLLNS